MIKGFLSILLILLISFIFVSCTKEEKGEFISVFYEDSGETISSDLFLNSDEEVCIFIDNQLSVVQRNIIDNYVEFMGKPEEITSKIQDEGFEKILWMNSLINYQQTGDDYLFYIVKNGDESDICLLYIKGNEKIYNINITEITDSKYNTMSSDIRIIPCSDGNICFIKSYMDSNLDLKSRVYRINPISQELLNTYFCDYFPKICFDNELVGVSNNFDEIIFTDTVNGKVTKKISTNNVDEFADITEFDGAIYMVDKDGIFIVNKKYELEKILSASKTKYIGSSSAYKEMLVEEENEEVANELTKENYLMYRIIVKSEMDFIIEVTISDTAGYSYAKGYVEYKLN